MSKFLKSTKTVVLKIIQLAVVRKQTEIMNPNKIRQYKLKGGSKILKIWGEKVAAATIGDCLVNLDLWTIYSLSIRLF